MTPLARGYSFVMYLATADTAYTLPFPYLHADDIRVFAGDVGDAVEQTFSWDGTGGLKLDGEVPEGILVTIRRYTPRDHMLVSYVDGAQLPADDLNRNAKQLLYIMQEAIDFGVTGNGLPGGGSGWPAAGGGDTSLAIQQIIDALMQSSTMQLLLQLIEPLGDWTTGMTNDWTAGLAETILEDILRNDQMFDTRRSVDQRVAFVETTTTHLVTDTASTAANVTELYAQHDDNAAQVIVAQQAIADEKSARAEAITQVEAATADSHAKALQALQAVSDETGARALAITQVEAATTAVKHTADGAQEATVVNLAKANHALQAVTDETGARARAITQVEAATTAVKRTADGAQEAVVIAHAKAVQAFEAVTDEVGARAHAITQVEASTAVAQRTADGAQEATVVNLAKANHAIQAVTDETGARSQAITQVEASTAVAQHTADGAQEAVVIAQAKAVQAFKAATDETSARAEAVTQVSAEAQGFSNIVDERITALVKGSPDPNDDPQWTANWAVRINAQKLNGDPVIAGVGLGIDSETGSSFIVQADRFGIVSPSYTGTGAGQMKFPFVVGTIGGVSTVGITGQLIVDGSVTADKVSANSLSAISANLGTVNGGTFKTHTLDAQGNVTAPNEFRVEVTNQPTDNYPLWIGSNAKTSANAVFWVDRDGNAMFRGVVSAGNITDKLQVQATGEWTGSIQASVGGRTSTFTLPAPTRLGEPHSPVLMIELELNIKDDDHAEAAGGSVFVERQVGSTWVELRRQKVRGFKFTSIGSSLFLFDAPTTTAQTYRVGLDAGDDPYPSDMYMISTHAILFGLR